jgi:hypothetical protein
MMSEWISVKDRLPNDGEFVDIYIRSTANKKFGKRLTSVSYYKGKFILGEDVWSNSVLYVTHWMPQPEPPNNPQQTEGE